MKITLYSTHCPKCLVLEEKLQDKNIDYELVTDIDEMVKKGFQSAPVLEVDGKLMDFSEANKWVNER